MPEELENLEASIFTCIEAVDNLDAGVAALEVFRDAYAHMFFKVTGVYPGDYSAKEA